MEAPSSYPFVAFPCNDSLHGLLPEATRGQVARRSRRGASACHDRACPHLLGCELRQGGVDDSGCDPSLLEIVANQRVTVFPFGQRHRAGTRDSLVVDQTGATERVEHTLPLGGRHAPHVEFLFELGGGAVAAPQGSDGRP